MLPSRSLLPTNHFGTDCSACCPRGPYFPPTTSRPTAQHVAVAVPTSHQPLRRGPYFTPTTSEPTAQHVSVAVPTPTNHFGTDCSACCRRGPYSHQPLRRGPYFTPTASEPTAHCRGPYLPPTTSEPTAQHVAVAVPIAPINHFGTDCSACCRRGPYFPPTTSSRSLFHTNHFGTDCSACFRRGPYFPPITSEPTAQHVAFAVPTSHQPLRNRLLSMLPSRSLLPINHFGTDCSACCRRGPYFLTTTSEPTAQHVAFAVPTSHQPLRNRLLSMLPSRSLLPINHFGTDCSACCLRGPYFPPTT